jgi:UDP-sugar transporter A1/2/3
MAGKNSSFIKYLSLILLIMQTTGIVLVMRYSRTSAAKDTPRYLSSTAVVNSEIMKLVACLFLVWYQTGIDGSFVCE